MVKKILARTFLGLLLALLYLPIIWMIVFSFTDTTSINNWNGFSLKAYAELFTGRNSGAIFTALGNTMIIAIVSALLATLLATFAAIGLNSMRKKRTKAVYQNISQIPMLNADIITAISLMLLFSTLKTFLRLEGELSMLNVILAHTTFCAPYALLNILPRLRAMDNSTYEAALDLGAKPMQAIFKVIIPQLLPGIIMGFIMSITLSIDDFVVSNFVIDGFDTLSTYIYTAANGKKPLPIEIRALSSLMFLFILGILLAINIKSSKHTQNLKAKGVRK